MAKTKTTDTTVAIETTQGVVEIQRNARILVVKNSQITVGENGDRWPHDYATTVTDSTYQLQPLEIEGGASYVSAGLWADHVASGSPGLTLLLEDDALKIYQDADVAYRSIQVGDLRAVIAKTRDGRVLREWEAIEQDSDRPRRQLLDAIRERLRLFRDHTPVDYYSLGERFVRKPRAEASPS